MSLALTLPRWYDLHAHFRQDALIAPLIDRHLAMGCAGILAMPNTRPPVSRVFERDGGAGWSIESYTDMLRAAGGGAFQAMIVPLYLTRDTTPAMIAAGARDGALRACKYYPPHGTTNAEHGEDLRFFAENGVFAAMEEAGIVLCVHGEAHSLSGADYFGRQSNAEEIFYREMLPRVVEEFPRLKIVGEHVTTRAAVDFIRQAPDHVAATITPQHLLYTVGDLLKGLRYHLYCLPLLKFEEDRATLRAAVADPQNTKFFAGTDSAPHAEKVTPCGCAAGCYTGGIAPQLYAMAFEEAGVDLAVPAGVAAFRRFLCDIGPEFYGLPQAQGQFVLEKERAAVTPLAVPGGAEILPLPLGLGAGGNVVMLPWRVRGL